jgi:hypothetical protein
MSVLNFTLSMLIFFTYRLTLNLLEILTFDVNLKTHERNTGTSYSHTHSHYTQPFRELPQTSGNRIWNQFWGPVPTSALLADAHWQSPRQAGRLVTG